MPTYEVFLKPEGRDGFAHAGSFDAPDDAMAALYCRETYVRRGEGTQAWVVDRANLVVVDEAQLAVTRQRHHAVNDGVAIAARRREANRRPGDSSNDGSDRP
jgi:phenylacetate-CoA oxygenase PaaH subunit